MTTSELLVDAFGRIRQLVQQSVTGADSEGLSYRPEPGANSIAWLAWHLTRTQDDHVSEIAGIDQAWIAEGWHDRFEMEADPDNTGYGHGPDDVAAILADPDVLLAYHEVVADRSLVHLATLDDAGLDRIIDRSYDPPVTVGVRLVSVVSDNLQHAGQARYLRGIIDRLL